MKSPVTVVVLQTVFWSVACPAGRRALAAEPGNPFPVGEKLTYKVKFRGIPAGVTTMRVVGEEVFAGRKAVRFQMTTKSGRLISIFFEVDHVSGSVIDLGTRAMLHFAADRKNGRRREFEEITVDPETGIIHSFTRNHKGKEKVVQTPITDPAVRMPIQDVLSFFYYLRTVEFELGRHTVVGAFQGHKPYPLRLGVDGLERMELKRLGRFWAYVIHPAAAMPGLFSEEGDATVWFEQTTHTLLKMLVNTPSGPAYMTLVKAERSPLTSAPGARRRK